MYCQILLNAIYYWFCRKAPGKLDKLPSSLFVQLMENYLSYRINVFNCFN